MGHSLRASISGLTDRREALRIATGIDIGHPHHECVLILVVVLAPPHRGETEKLVESLRGCVREAYLKREPPRTDAKGPLNECEHEALPDLASAHPWRYSKRCDVRIIIADEQPAVPHNGGLARHDHDVLPLLGCEFIEEDAGWPWLVEYLTLESDDGRDVAASHRPNLECCHCGHAPSDRKDSQLICTSGSRMYTGRTSSGPNVAPLRSFIAAISRIVSAEGNRGRPRRTL